MQKNTKHTLDSIITQLFKLNKTVDIIIVKQQDDRLIIEAI